MVLGNFKQYQLLVKAQQTRLNKKPHGTWASEAEDPRLASQAVFRVLSLSGVDSCLPRSLALQRRSPRFSEDLVRSRAQLFLTSALPLCTHYCSLNSPDPAPSGR